MPSTRRTRRTRKTTTAARARRRTTRNRKRFSIRRLVWPFVILLMAAGLGVGGQRVLESPELRIAKVRVSGTRLIDGASVEADVKRVIQQDRSFFGRYHNILILPKRRIVRRLLADHPEVRSVVIGRILPKTVVVRVQERRTFATVTNGAGFWLVDRDGLAFHRTNGPIASVPTVELPPDAAIRLGRRIDHSGIAPALACVDGCRPLKRKIDKISVDQAGNLCLNIGSDFYVKLGQPIEIPEKLKKLSEIIQSGQGIGEDALYIDVSCTERPVMKPKAGASGPSSGQYRRNETT